MKPLLEDTKNHLRVDSADDDALIATLIDAAYDATEAFLRRDFAVDYPTELPAAITVAVLMRVGALYYTREATSAEAKVELPFGYQPLAL